MLTSDPLSATRQEPLMEAVITRKKRVLVVDDHALVRAGFKQLIDRTEDLEVGGEDFYLDLLFYHRGLRRLVALDLKLGRFAPADLGQMEFYLRWLKKHELRAGEEEPLGLILCAEKSDERIELLELEPRGIRVAEYLTELPPRKVLQRKLHEAVRLARARLANRKGAV